MTVGIHTNKGTLCRLIHSSSIHSTNAHAHCPLRAILVLRLLKLRELLRCPVTEARMCKQGVNILC